MYQNIGKPAFKKDLTNTIALLEKANNPHKTGVHIHVAGSNGKGSVCNILASILFQAGYKVGLYTSPHLVDFRERIRVNGVCIPKDNVIAFVQNYANTIETIQPSFFEATVCMAFEYFKSQQTNVNIIEVGLGGRLDSTNVIKPILSIITNISLEHTDMLGDTVELIAAEKAGIIKQSIPVVIGDINDLTKPIFEDKAKACTSKIVFSDLIDDHWLTVSELKANYQLKNIGTVLTSVKELNLNGFKITNQHIKAGLANVSINTGFKGRWYTLMKSPKVILDTAHNEDGLINMLTQLDKETYHNLFIIFGVVKDKKLETILPLLPKHAQYFVCKPSVERGLDSAILNNELLKFNLNSTNFGTAENALNQTLKLALNTDLILAFGSNFVVADILTKYDQ